MKYKFCRILINILVFFCVHSQSMDILDSENQKIKELINGLSLDEKIGQLFMVSTVAGDSYGAIGPGSYRWDKEYIEQLIKEYKIGGLSFHQKSTSEQLRDSIVYCQGLNANINKIPLWIGQDFEWGLTMRIADAIRFPKNMTLGAIKDDNSLYEMGKEIGRQCRKLGVHINFAPVVDINTNHDNPIIGDRSFGENKKMVTRKAIAIMKGLQEVGVISCAKHFPGHGDTAQDSHKTLPKISHNLKRINDIEIYPFKKLIASGVRAIMVAHLDVPTLDPTGTPSSLSPKIVTQLLKEKLGFRGLVITDGLDMQGVQCNQKEAGDVELRALLAGNDLLLCSPSVPQAVSLIKHAINEGAFSEAELDKRVAKIIMAKSYAFEGQEENLVLGDLHKPLHTEYAYALKKRLYYDAITLIKNTNNILPLKKESDLFFYVQLGNSEISDFQRTLGSFSTFVSYNVSSDATADDIKSILYQLGNKSKIIISLFCNRLAQQRYGITNDMIEFIENIKACNPNVILVIFGSPYFLKLFHNFPAILLAYEDDSDAQEGAAKVLVRELNAKGKLPVSITGKVTHGIMDLK